MQIQVNTESSVEGSERLAQRVEGAVSDALDRFSDRITRVEAHLSDENSDKKSGAADKRCVLEARLAGLQPVAVRHDAPTLDLAVDGAVEKLSRAIGKTLGRLGNR